MWNCTRSTILAALLLFASPAAAAPSFQGLGDLPGDDFFSFGYDLSGDGTVVVGETHGANGHEAFRWDGTMVGIGDLPNGIFDSSARAVNSDGSRIAGIGDSVFGNEAFLYDHGTATMTPLGSLIAGGTSAAHGISSDGTVVVGISSSATGLQAFRWQGTMVGLGDLPGGAISSLGLAVSGDGLTVVGGSSSANGDEAFIWQGVMQGLGDLAGGGFDSRAFGVDSTGTRVVGRGESAGGNEAFLWNAAVGMQGLGDLPGGIFSSVAFDVNDDSVVVGSSSTAVAPEAFVFDWGNGMRRLQDVLEAHGLADDLVGWRLTEARAVSDDGLTYAGFGINPDGNFEAWVATVPEPSTGLLLGLGLLLLGGRRPAR